jgi:serine/threonine-protein kinase HipA
MNATVNVANVNLWGNRVGAVALDEYNNGIFEFDPEFLKLGLDIAPVTMPLEKARRDPIYSFPGLRPETFKGLPGLLADSLPDKFGQAIIDTWLARQGRGPEDFSIIERLCYTGTRAVGALEFQPSSTSNLEKSVDINLGQMVSVVREVIKRRNSLDETLTNDDDVNQAALLSILMVGTSAGGARAKAVIAFDEKTGQVMSGQADAPQGFEHWLLKFDGAKDIELGETGGFGRIEYGYYLMAKDAGIKMTKCQLLEENGCAHFMTRRFDRVNGKKLHLQSLCAIAHYDFNMPGAYGYEQALMIMRKMRISRKEQLELYRRMVFNVIARNQDDHTKNIALLMDQQGEWSLSPAFDMTYSYNPDGEWTHQHQMSINNKRDQITREDLLAVAHVSDLKHANKVIDQVQTAVQNWPYYANEAKLDEKRAEAIKKQHRSI